MSTVESRALFGARVVDWQRHVVDLQKGGYEGALTRAGKEDVFLRAFELLTPVAVRVLTGLSDAYLGSAGDVSTTEPADVAPELLTGANRQPEGGLLGSWNLTWPRLRDARSRLTGAPMPPVQIFAMFPHDFTHPHVSLFDLDEPRQWIACWPLQVVTPEDANRQEPILAAIAEADMHERTFAGDLNWRLLTV